jgi:hypothetical protein
MPRTPAYLSPDRAHLAFVAAGVTLAIAGGFSLAVALPIDAALDFNLGPRWLQLVQAHGHLQAIGFAGLVIMGVALRVGPRFAGQHVQRPGLIPLVFLTVIAAVLLRATGQALADHSPFEAVMAAGAWLEVVAALLFAWLIVGATAAAGRRGTPSAVFFVAGSFWFVVQALFGAIWLTDAAIDDATLIPNSRNAVLLFLQFFGFHLMFILGVGLRALPTFFGRDLPSTRHALAAFALIQVAIALTTAAFAWRAVDGGRIWEVESTGLVLLALGFLAALALIGARGAPHRLRPATQPIGRLPQAAMAWLAITSGVLIYFALRGAVDARGLLPSESDAIRHLIGLGVITMAIIGMAHIILPEFGVERLTGRSGKRRAWLFGLGLSIAALSRASPGLTSDLVASESDYWHMASAGIIGFALITWFGWLLLRAARGQTMLLEQVAVNVETARPRPPGSPD